MRISISAKPTWESEREVVLEERRLRVEDQPGGLAFESLAAIAWQAHPYRWPVIGWRADIEAVTVEACQAFFDTYYAANNLVLVIVGDINTKDTLSLVEKEFGKLRRADSIPRNPGKVVAQRGERRAQINLDARIQLIYGAWHAPAAGHPDADALDVASQILSAGRSSRLYRQLVYEDEQALYAEGGYWALQEAGLFFAVAGARPGVSVDAVEAAFLRADRSDQAGWSQRRRSGQGETTDGSRFCFKAFRPRMRWRAEWVRRRSSLVVFAAWMNDWRPSTP